MPVIPAQAGMILKLASPYTGVTSYPCTSGDDPEYTYKLAKDVELSLHKRG